jgi:DNA-binding NarL/FixJ family response regulator
LAIRIVLAEDDYFVREGVRRLLETQHDIEVVATCDDLDSLLEVVDAKGPDVVALKRALSAMRMSRSPWNFATAILE